MRAHRFFSGRRSFLALAGGSVALAHWLGRAVAKAEGEAGPKRLLLVSRPNGTILPNWMSGAQRGPILDRFESVWDRAVALQGASIEPRPQDRGGVTDGDPHSLGSITLMTAAPRNPETIPQNDNHWNTVESLDQRLAREAPALSGAPVPSLQVGSFFGGPAGDEPSRALSFSSAASPLYPDVSPSSVFNRLFTNLPPPGEDSEEAVMRLRESRRSVLDFVKDDLQRVRPQFPSETRSDLDAHEQAVRELEDRLDDLVGADCVPPTAPGEFGDPGGSADELRRIGLAQFELVRAAFACDLTRVVTFMWAGCAADNRFGDVVAENFAGNSHHDMSHAAEYDDQARQQMATIDDWYAQQTNEAIASFVATTDPFTGTSLMDNTLIWYFSEITHGWDHALTDIPIVLFGGDGVGLVERGRIFDATGRNTTDLWRSLAPWFGLELDDLQTPSQGAIPGLFA